MSQRTVNPRQLEVLRWIVDGCPEGVMTDVTYKTTAVALRNRRLVTVSRTKGSWTAEATPAGRYFVEHGSYPEGHWRTTAPRTRAAQRRPSSPRYPSSTPPPRGLAAGSRRATGHRPVDQMLADAAAAGTAGFLINEPDIGYFTNLIGAAERYGKVPPGTQLRLARDGARGPVVRLVEPPSPKAEPGTTVPVAERLHRPHPVARDLRVAQRPDGMRGEVRHRARRGYGQPRPRIG